MKLNITSKTQNLICIPVFEKNKKINFFENKKEISREIIENIKTFNYNGKENSNLYFNIKKQKYLLYAIKEKYELEDLRKTFSNLYNSIKEKNEKKILIRLPKENEEEIKATIEGLDLSNYTFDKYISKKDESNFEINLDIPDKYKKLLDETIKINTQVKFTRDLINENSEDMTPLALEKLAKEFAKKNKLKIKILNEKEIQKEKLNLLWAVGKGSQFPPRLIILEYNGNPKSKEITALVGKGITFDTGGINLKPSGFLEDMKCDMGGAATAFGTFRATVETKLKKNLILVMSCAENAISGKAYKPGDVFISHANISVEIANTDAEGRLALADALSYLQKKYKPTTIIDLATLTGASLVALGPSLIAMMGNDKNTMKQIFESGEKTFERVWELPIYDEHRDLMKSKIADIKNLGGKFGGCITAGAFLEKFIKEDIKWVHLDIAGAAYARKSDLYIPEYGTGRGVRLLVDYLKNN